MRGEGEKEKKEKEWIGEEVSRGLWLGGGE
jgi:hypothetical protein